MCSVAREAYFLRKERKKAVHGRKHTISSASLSYGKLFLKGAFITAMSANNDKARLHAKCSEITNIKILGELLKGGQIVTSSWVFATSSDDFEKV